MKYTKDGHYNINRVNKLTESAINKLNKDEISELIHNLVQVKNGSIMFKTLDIIIDRADKIVKAEGK